MTDSKAQAPSRKRKRVSARQIERDRAKAERLDVLVADAEQRVAEQALRYEIAVFDGHSGSEEKKLLRIFENVLFESIKSREVLEGRLSKDVLPEI